MIKLGLAGSRPVICKAKHDSTSIQSCARCNGTVVWKIDVRSSCCSVAVRKRALHAGPLLNDNVKRGACGENRARLRRYATLVGEGVRLGLVAIAWLRYSKGMAVEI